ncbi:MAG: protein kinase [Acidobacteria bacterium]|nr:protein kinase [Acidobacteriota bacterium]
MAEKIKKGSALGHYRIAKKIGEGGMGEVFLAEDTRLGRQAAIKILSSARSHDPDRLKRFRQEARAASALNHPNILTVYEIGEAAGTSYIATEWIKGETLRDHLVKKEELSLERILRITEQVADALSAAHSAGIIHRDIKPENIMLRNDGYAKVLDFGLAKLAETDVVSSGDGSRVDTTPGIVMGTVAYMSPEQARGKGVDTRTDIFSLGVVLYEMLTRRQPFTGETNSHAIVAILEHEPPPMTGMDVTVPPDLEAITRRCLSKKADDRFQTAADLAGELRSLRKRMEFEAELERSAAPGLEEKTAILGAAPDEALQQGATIAVLPFQNMSHGKDGDYFSDGLAEELLNVLSKIRGLRVAARTSAFSFKGKQTTVAEIGRTLNVASILEGSIRMAGNRVRISVQLVNVSDGYHIWSDTYDRMMDDIFAVQDDIAQSVVEELRVKLLGESSDSGTTEKVRNEIAAAAKGRADDPEAQRLMMLGLYFLDRTTPADAERAISYFKQALARDPEFARCWAELGFAHCLQAGKAWIAFDEGYDLARKAAERALELEPDLAEAHACMARIHLVGEMNVAEAVASYDRAMELAPGSSRVLDGAALLKYRLCKFDEALPLSRQVVAQDPLSGAIWHNLGLIAHSAGLLAEAEYALSRSIELSPQRLASYAFLAMVLLDEGRLAEALERASVEPDDFWRHWAEAILLYESGEYERADAALKGVMDDADGGSFQLAEIYARRGDVDLAFEWLTKAYDEGDPGIMNTMASALLRPLHGDARWRPMLEKIGLSGAN